MNLPSRQTPLAPTGLTDTMSACAAGNGFAALGLPPPLLDALGEAGYEAPSQLQQACIPPILAGRDLVAETHAGTGKALAFALPLLAGIDLADRLPQVLILTPSDETAVRMAELFLGLAHGLPGFHVLPIYGGDGQVVQLRQLDRGVHVVIGSPRWTLDHVDKDRLTLGGLRALVVDEADELLHMGFREDIDALFARSPAGRQALVFAARRTYALDCLVGRHLNAPVVVAPPLPALQVPTLRQRHWPVDAGHKLEALIRLIEIEPRFEAALIFVHTQTDAVALAEKLGARGYSAAAAHGGSTRRECDLVAARLAMRQIDIVVATDTITPQLDLGRISHVIHYDLPCDAAAYQARIAGAPAVRSILLLVSPHETTMLHDIEHSLGTTIDPLALPERPRGR